MAAKVKKTNKKPAGEGASSRASATGGTGFVFADPQPTPDDYAGFSQSVLQGDSDVKSSANLLPFPAPRQPATLSLAQVIGADAVAQITAAKSMVFHSVGDTGGIKEPSKQFAVADAMAADLESKTYQTGLPAFFYHLGDVVYYLGQEQYYYDQFYDPYRDYAGPIFAIPGNHDGMTAATGGAKTLAAFLENFCATTPTKNPDAQQFARTTMTQPGVYFTLDAPFVKIIGLYSNTSEGTTQGVISGSVVGNAQLTFLQQQLQAIATARKTEDPSAHQALIIAVHHPCFTGSEDHAPSPNVLSDLDAACKTAGIMPDLVLSGHSHLYERYTRYVSGSQVPFVTAGMGGYFNLSTFNTTGTPPLTGSDLQGNKLVLESFDDQDFGYLRLTASAVQLQCKMIAVNVSSGATTQKDSFTIDLKAHTVSTP